MDASRDHFTRAQALRLGAGALSAATLAALPMRLPAASPGAGVAPADALARLMAGNARFVAGALEHYDGAVERRIALAGGQAPYASILTCSDSRVPPELVFDEDIGQLFVVRDAGNFVVPAVLGTFEYGYSALGVKLIVVLGHESCGAVNATYDALESGKPLPPNLDAIENGIEDGIKAVVAAHGSKTEATIANAKAQAQKMMSSPVLGPAIASGDCKVVAAEYRLASGAVTFL